MEGYSVTEAASILGVTTERVWELLARGVLAGAPDGESGMRVYLQPRPGPAPPAVEVHARTDAPRPEPDRELSPFRELLTEFRSLTERYGQALLALGESRGEVAALRSRVDMLEARVDLRLSGAAAPSPVMPWLGRHAAGEMASEPVPEPELPPVPDAGAGEDHGPDAMTGEGTPDEADSEARGRRRRSSHRHATDAFAEALARAQDPSLRDLPGAADAADALAALREETRSAAETEAEPPDAALPRELPVADAVPVPDELASEERVAEDRAPWEPVADELTPEPVAQPGPAPTGPTAPEPEAEPEEEAVAVPEPEPQESAVPEPEPTASEPEPQESAVPEPEPAASEPEPQESAVPEPEPTASEPEPQAVHGPDVTVDAPPETPVEPGEQHPTVIESVDHEISEAAALQEAAAAAVGAEEPEESGQTIEVALAEPAVDGVPEEPVTAEPEPPAPREPIEWDHERYTTSLGEPDWYAADELPPPPPHPSAAATPAPEDLAAETPRPESDEEPWPVEDEVAPPWSMDSAEQLPAPDDQPEPPAVDAEPPAATEGGADEMEVAATGTPRPGETRLPGAWDLDDALRALDALAGRNRSEGQPVPTPSDATERSYRSPASRAYRRLRRILPG